MSARTKSIPRAKIVAIVPRHGNGGRRISVAELKANNERLREERDHWHKRYFRRHEEAQKLEGLLSLRDAENADLKLELARKKAHIDKLEKKLFNRTSEANPLDAGDPVPTTPESEQAPIDSATPATTTAAEAPKEKRKRGKQPGSPGFGPKNHEQLPLDDEVVYSVDESCCPDCGDQYREMSAEKSDIVEVDVRAYRRRHTRKKYGHFCKKKDRWVTKRAKGPARLFPHSIYGISFWVFLLNGKFSLQIPVNRLCILLEQKDLHVSQGTIVAGFSRILKLIAPLIAEIKRYSREEKSHWHIDDAGWKTFERIEGKNSFGWYMWVFRSDDVCVYIASPSRAREVPKSHLKDSSGVVSCDRLQSNRKLGDYLIYAFCWVHERRHFRELYASYPELRAICNEFLQLISNLFHYNKQRLLHEDGSIEQQRAQTVLSDTLIKISELTEQYLANPKLHPELRRVLKGIKTDWDGLYTFFELSAIPPDNNAAERALRGPVVGRKNYYGSGSMESAELAAAMFTLNTTLALNKISLEHFLTEYFEACAANGSKPPPNAARFLPWNRRPPPPAD